MTPVQSVVVSGVVLEVHQELYEEGALSESLYLSEVFVAKEEYTIFVYNHIICSIRMETYSNYQAPFSECFEVESESRFLIASGQAKGAQSSQPVNASPDLTREDIDFLRTSFLENPRPCGFKTLALSRSAWVFVDGDNFFLCSKDAPEDMQLFLGACAENGKSIDEVILKDDNSWLVLYNGYTEFSGVIPSRLHEILEEALGLGLKVFSADWAPYYKDDPLIISVNNPSLIRKRPDLDCHGVPSFYSTRLYEYEDDSEEYYGYGGVLPFSRTMRDREFKGQNIGELCRTFCLSDGALICYKNSNPSSQLFWGTGGGEYWFRQDNRDGKGSKKTISKLSVEPYDPFYAVITGAVQHPWRLKIFDHGRYFISNSDGSEFYFHI